MSATLGALLRLAGAGLGTITLVERLDAVAAASNAPVWRS